jgi:hypothetical protein
MAVGRRGNERWRGCKGAVEAVDRTAEIEMRTRAGSVERSRWGRRAAAVASAALPPSASGQGVEAGRRCPGGKKRREDGGKGGLPLPFLGEEAGVVRFLGRP